MTNWWDNAESAGDAKAEDTWKKQDWSADGGWNASASPAAPEAADKSSWGNDDKKAADNSSWGNDDKKAADNSSWGNDDKKDASADDPWAKKTEDTWGAKDAGADDDWNKPPPAHDFWNMQTWHKDSNILSRKADWEMDQDDANLFSTGEGTTAGNDFAKYDAVPVDVSGDKASAIPTCKTFEEIFQLFGKEAKMLPEALMANIRRCRYQMPTPVQKYAIPVGLCGRDVMCCAQTGSGKTAAFLMPVIGRMMKHHTAPVGSLEAPFEGACCPDTLIITPTRELSIQIHEEALKFCHRTPYIAAVVYGGQKPKIQLEIIAKGCDVLVATPGRLSDFANRGVIKLDRVNVLVLDEADRMLDMGFEPAVRDIVEKHGMPGKENRQTMMFSATFPESCQRLAGDYLYEYIWIGVGIVGGAVDTVNQELVKVAPADKFKKLTEVLDKFYEARPYTEKTENRSKCLVFVNAKDTAKFLDEQLYELKMDTGALHGNLTQDERETNLKRFRTGQIDVMIATDVAARGLDIEKVDLVINYDMPTEIDSYIHRIGRTGRIGNKGEALTFVSCDESDLCLEGVETLKSLCQVMRDAKSHLPTWLEPLIDATAASKSSGSGWKWGGKDVRGATTTDSYRGAGSGEAWGDWKKNEGGDDPWKKEGGDDPWKKEDKGGGYGGGGSGDGGKEMCGDFKRGDCSRGDRCKYSHGDGDGGGGGDDWNKKKDDWKTTEAPKDAWTDNKQEDWKKSW